MKSKYKNCQSCGMPLNKDENSGGTEIDGSKSIMYCSHCYENGSFVLPNITVEEMRERVINKMVEMKFPKFLAKVFTNNIYKLQRWSR